VEGGGQFKKRSKRPRSHLGAQLEKTQEGGSHSTVELNSKEVKKIEVGGGEGIGNTSFRIQEVEGVKKSFPKLGRTPVGHVLQKGRGEKGEIRRRGKKKRGKKRE